MQDKRPICAIATAPGQGAIGVVRVSAPEPDIITALAAGILGPERRLVARKAAYGPFLAADAQPIDYGLALWFPAPHSYTGEHILELQGHGGPVVQQILLRRVLQVGAAFGIRLAEPGEFTERAFLNDKLDLVQAEAVADLIEASTEQAARSATRSLQGVFSRQIDDLAEQLLTLRMLVEATLDFPEEEIDFLQKADAAGRLARIDDTLRRLFDTAQSGARLRQGLNVVLTGAPNVGKSSLLNALAGAEVAIVTPIAGTTRDRVIEQISIEGVPINLIDTAGLRDTDDPVEKIGIQRTWAEIEKADVVVHLRAADELAREDENQTPGEIGQGNGKQAVPAITPTDAGTGALPEQRPGQEQTGSVPLDISRLEASIEARVPASARRLTVINKIDLVEGEGRLTSEMSGGESCPQSSVDEGGASPSTSRMSTEKDTSASEAETPSSTEILRLSARTGQGIEAFRRKLLDIARERHLQALSEALTHLQNARQHVSLGDQALDLFAEELRLAHQALGRITGAVTADDLLGVIFSRFCIGK